MRGTLLALLLWGTSLSQARAEDTTTIAAYGDSLFSGLGVNETDSFPAQLQSRLTFENYRVTVLNDGVAGNTSSSGLARVDAVVDQHPALAIVEFGGNDRDKGVPLDQTRQNLDQMLMRLTQSSIKVLLVGQKINANDPGAAQYNSMFCDLARQYNAACYPSFYDGIYGNASLLQSDGVHPNAQGVGVLVDRMYPLIAANLKR